MGRRSDFLRRERDFYPTPAEAVRPLAPHLPANATYAEPCWGEGHLEDALSVLAPGLRCVERADVEDRSSMSAMTPIYICDATQRAPRAVDLIVTNPPWPRMGGRGEPVLSIVRTMAPAAPTWLLLPWTFHAAAYAAAVAPWCVKVVPIGRVAWMGNGVPSKDDAAWSLWDARHEGATQLLARGA